MSEIIVFDDPNLSALVRQLAAIETFESVRSSKSTARN